MTEEIFESSSPNEDKPHREIAPIRPRDLIEKDLSIIDKKEEDLFTQFCPVREKLKMLPEDQYKLIDDFATLVENGEIDKGKLLLPADLMDIGNLLFNFIDESKKLDIRRNEIEIELIPYRRQDLETLLQKITPQINYDAVLDYYKDTRREGADLLINTASELYLIRRYQHDLISTPEKEKDYHFYDFRFRSLLGFIKTWEEKQFLYKDLPPNFHIVKDDPETRRTSRVELVCVLSKVLEQLDQFVEWASIYQHNLSFYDTTHSFLSSIAYVFEDKGENNHQAFKDFNKIDFDPRFIDSAKKQIDSIIGVYRINGHLPETEDIQKQERERIDSLEENQIDNIKWEGFTPPEGMVAVITPEEIYTNIKSLLPPDFLHGLTAIANKRRRENSIDENEKYVETGLYTPSYDSQGKLVAATIEVYKDLFVPQDSSDHFIKFKKECFMSTIWHEFGHNAHHMMNYDELNAWEHLVSHDISPVSWYVKHSREIDIHKGKREDFTESFRLFITNPALLIILSPLRYKFMFTYFRRRLNTNQQESFINDIQDKIKSVGLLWQELGITTEKIRDEYLKSQEIILGN